jgi:hypothetical protein
MRYISVQHRKKALRWAIAIAFGAAVTWSFTTHFIRRDLKTALDRGIVLPYLAALFSVLVFMGLFRFALPRLRRLSRYTKITWLLAAFAIGALLVISIPIKPPETAYHRLVIVATGQKNAGAKASEVWVTGFEDGDGTQIAPSSFTQEVAWEIIDGVPTSRQQQPATLRWEGSITGDAQLNFIAHAWSGIAQIIWDGQTRTVDLFATGEILEHRAVMLPAQGGALADPAAGHLLFAAADTGSLGLLLFLASVWLATKTAFQDRIRPVHQNTRL